MKNMKLDWRERWFAPLYGAGGIRPQQEGLPEIIYAPTLEHGFKLARTMWPTASGWTCKGEVKAGS
jgi:hypothetical protein